MNHNGDDSELQEPLRTAVESILAEPRLVEAEKRVLSAACALYQPKIDTHRRRRRRVVARGSASCVIVIVGLILFMMRTPRVDAWSEIVDAVSQQRWLLVTTENPKSRTWYSKTLGVLASEVSTGADQGLVFIDLQQKFVDCYAVKGQFGPVHSPGTVSRTSLRDDNRMGIDRELAQFEVVVSHNLSGMFSPDVDVLEHRATKYTRGNQNVTEHRFLLTPEGDDSAPHRVTVVVNEQTQLPIEQRIQPSNGPEIVRQISFPESGPKDIFALGAPQHAKIVDQRPGAHVQTLLDQFALARVNTGAYSAIVIERSERQQLPQFLMASRIWKDRTRWRIERIQKRASLENPTSIETNHAPWWHDFADGAKYFVMAISDGHAECTYHAIRQGNQPEEDSENPGFLLVRSFDEVRRPHRSLVDPDTHHDHLLPEWVGFPKLHQNAEFAIEPNPLDGSIWLTGTSPDSKTRIWLDPAHGNMARKHEYYVVLDGVFQLQGELEIFEVTQTPTGEWLPGAVRSTGIHKGKRSQSITTYYYDFDISPEEGRFEITDR
jgi:hypothetical protein